MLSIKNSDNVYTLLHAVYHFCLYSVGAGEGGSSSHKSLQILSEHFHNISMKDTILIFLTRYQCMAMVHLKLHICFG